MAYLRVSHFNIDKIGGINMENHMPIWEKINLTIKEASIYSNIGINKIQEISKAPRCHFVLYVGKKKLIKRKEFEKYLSEEIEI